MSQLWSQIALLVLLSLQPAWAASKKNEAEAARLTDEIHTLAARNAWSGVDRVYRQLQMLEKRGVEIGYETHILGAHAARARGSVMDTYYRLNAADKIESTQETMEWLAQIYANYGNVRLQFAPAYKDELVLHAMDVGFAPDQRSTIEAAQRSLTETRMFVGLLPLGRYSLGHVDFAVEGGPEITIIAKKAPPDAVIARPDDEEPEPEPPPPPQPEQQPPDTSRSFLFVGMDPPVVQLYAADMDMTTEQYEQHTQAVKDALLGLVDIGRVEIHGGPEHIFVEASDPALELIGMSLRQLAIKIERHFALDAKMTQTVPQRISIPGSFGSLDPLREMVLPIVGGGRISLDEIASIRRGYGDGSTSRALAAHIQPNADLAHLEAEVLALLRENDAALALGLHLELPVSRPTP